MVRKHKRTSWAEKAWDQYSAEFPPSPDYIFHSRSFFLAGYRRGRACVLGLAWLYCTLVSIMYGLIILAYFVLR